MNHLPKDAATLGQVVALLFALALLTSGFCKAQPQERPPESDLKRLSSDELKACLDAAKSCAISDVSAIEDELARRLPTLPSEQLLACFDDWKICGVDEDRASGWPISDELARRDIGKSVNGQFAPASNTCLSFRQ